MVYKELTDEELVVLAKVDKGKPFEVLVARYDKTVRGVVKKYVGDGKLEADKEDLQQLGRLALNSAVENFNGQDSFFSFAYACIENKVRSALRSSNADKNKPLKGYVPLFGDDDVDKTEILADKEVGPEDFFIDNEKKEEIDKILHDELSELEYKIFNLHLQGYSYEEIGNKLQKTVKSVDNALQRIRRKLRSKLADIKEG